LPINVVDDFNLYAAAFGPEYDDVIGAVIDVALRKPRTDRLGGKVNISLVGADGLIEGPVAPHQSVLFSVRRSYFDLLLGTLEDKKKGEKITIPRYYDYQGKYIWDVNDANTITVNANGASDSVGFTFSENSDVAKREPILVGSSSIKLSYHTQDIEWSSRLTSTAVNKLYAGRMLTTQSSSIASAGTVDARFVSIFLRDQFRFEPAPNHVVTLGGNYSNLDVDLDLDIIKVSSGEGDPDPCFSCAPREQYKKVFPVRSELRNWSACARPTTCLG
ncbi:MAG: hypothetical protein HY273_10480, partial [Gammaproteobacteria bacterium]|nr:hypothetical protein [Gammaproteobacteria bacterium]